MASVNKVIIVGNLGRDPEIRYMPSGDAIANIAVATSYKSKDRNTGEQKELTEWHRISFFGRLAEIVGQYLKKGSSVYVEGRLQTRKYTDKDGVERYATDIIAENMQMLGGRQGMGGGGGTVRRRRRRLRRRRRAARPRARRRRPRPPVRHRNRHRTSRIWMTIFRSNSGTCIFVDESPLFERKRAFSCAQHERTLMGESSNSVDWEHLRNVHNIFAIFLS